MSHLRAPAAPARLSTALVARAVTFLTAAAALGVAAGMLGALMGLARAFRSVPLGLLAIGGIASAAVIVGGCWLSTASVRRIRDLWFMVLLSAFWVVTRLALVAALPRYAPYDDEAYLHRFVSMLAAGRLSAETLAGLSSWSDYCIFVPRSFPFFYPLRLLFGDSDLAAVYVLNALLGAATLVFVFLIARRLSGSANARVAAWLLALSPLHVLDVLSYSPQVPGTFFFVVGIWLVLGAFEKRRLPWQDALWRGPALGLLMILGGIQRGMVDLLLLAIAAVLALTATFTKARRPGLARMVVTGALAIVVWFPVKSGFDAWVASHDVGKSRTHLLIYQTMGWNVSSLGGYLGRYEQLDLATAPQGKTRVMLSVLATEIAREPLVTLGVVPVAKAPQFFTLGYGGVSEQGMALSGYPAAAALARVARLAYAPIVLLMCIAGMAAAVKRWHLAWRLWLPILSTVLTGCAIVFFWVAQARYAHSIYFALLIFAAVGFANLRAEGLRALRLDAGAVKRVVAAGTVWLILWGAFAGLAYAAARAARSYQFADLRAAVVELAGQRAQVTRLDRWTGAWERVITLQAGTKLPATMRIGWPSGPELDGYPGLRLSLWTPEPVDAAAAFARVLVPCTRAGGSTYTLKELMTMKRGRWPIEPTGSAGRSVEVTLLPPDGQAELVLQRPLKLAFGYVLAEK